MTFLNTMVRWLLRKLYKVEVTGLEHLAQGHERVLIVANHTSLLDAVLLSAFLPGKLTFAVNTFVARTWYIKVAKGLFGLFPLDPANALSIKSLIKRVKQGGQVVIFPEGRITVTGSLMKVYPGPGLVADRADATIVPVRIEGAEYSPFSRLKGKVRRRWFPEIKLSVLPPQKLAIPQTVRGRARRQQAGKQLADIMTELMFASTNTNKTLLDVLVDARHIHGGQHLIVEDVERRPQSYNQLFTKVAVLGKALSRITQRKEAVGILLPNSIANVVAFLGLHRYGRLPAMLNFSVGTQGILSACHTAQIQTVITSKRFIEKARLTEVVAQLENTVNVIYLETLAGSISMMDKFLGMLSSRFDKPFLRPSSHVNPGDTAVILFTSGSEGTPKGVALSHTNLLSNNAQLFAKVDFNAQDIVLNALPMFHSFGLTAATLLPLANGMKTFLYPSPLHYRIIPEIAYSMRATLLFGTNTFLSGYARFAHDYDFSSVRYVFAGAEKLRSDVRQAWESRFGVKLFEGYGATETSPVIAANSPMESRAGTVGRLLPGMQAHIEPVPGVKHGGRLHVRGPNVMQGYLLASNPGVLVPPVSPCKGDGWYDTGDIVRLDESGFIRIEGRAKRFAKIGGEMVSLTAIEDLANQTWPSAQHAAISIPCAQKGEQLVLLTNEANSSRHPLLEKARRLGISELNVPRKIVRSEAIPLLGTGKTDYASVKAFVEKAVAS